MFFCKECGNESIKWQGQCGFCKEWNTLSEMKEKKANDKNNKTA
jgi:DNA repair protein RadA/Sms